MGGKIFLTSCGLKNMQESERLFEKLKPTFFEKRALVAINATTTGHNARAIPETVAKFEEGGAETQTILLDEKNIGEIFKFDFLYVVGGDVTPLIELAAKKNIKTEILKFLNGGGVYIGESAGSIFLGKNAKWYYDIKKNVSEKYEKDLKSYDTLGIVDKNVYPHFDKQTGEQQKATLEYEKQHGIEILKLADGDFVEIDI